MLKRLKNILNSYTDEDLEDMDLWINSDTTIDTILIDEYNIDLITSDSELIINGVISKKKNDR